MPRTNMGKAFTKQQRDEIIVRGAFGRVGIHTQREMADSIGASESTISKAFANGFSKNLIFRIHAVVDFTNEEREELLWKRL